ncbi:PREDICTED: cytochrome c1, heme protein, mitochondrial-like [Diuraphis noxia]|uniref:cytochrome c1, heme protein, mitochondrial-like n=1 Tax=Diuraphis noxia TaxID=143948 RepID=UPI000763AD11|nr:PREDICTED: cytochrome c1, heme protein, mitochondrial-like [Diuraphis noxia]
MTSTFSFFKAATRWSKNHKFFLTSFGVLAGGGSSLIYALEQSIHASNDAAHVAKQKWNHNGWFDTLDHASVRRGWEVYKNVCAACHSVEYLAYRELVGVCLTEDEAKAEAAEQLIDDGPDETGAMFKRPGKLSDLLPKPYPNEEAARYANGGAYPPDLTYITQARIDGENYIFALLTGYMDPPAGVSLAENQHYNPYFPGGAIGMAQALYDEIIEYGDGTPASQSQCAKDVVTFLKWCAEPEHDTRKLFAMKAFTILGVLNLVIWYLHRHYWSVLKTRKILQSPKSLFKK